MTLVTNHTSNWFATDPSTARSFGAEQPLLRSFGPEPMSPDPAC
jgi:hypothetical protein